MAVIRSLIKQALGKADDDDYHVIGEWIEDFLFFAHDYNQARHARRYMSKIRKGPGLAPHKVGLDVVMQVFYLGTWSFLHRAPIFAVLAAVAIYNEVYVLGGFLLGVAVSSVVMWYRSARRCAERINRYGSFRPSTKKPKKR